MTEIDLNEYNYELPDDRIAQHPVGERDMSNLLIYKEGNTLKDVFRNIENYIPSDSLLVFNNTKVIRARILFRKSTGAIIEILCLEPLLPSGYEKSFESKKPVEWKCIIGNLKKWKKGTICTRFLFKNQNYTLSAEKVKAEGEAWRIKFTWNNKSLCFGEVIAATGHIPLPPYINREDDDEDINRYQTIYSSINGSVAAPTAGLHFTDSVFSKLKLKGIKTSEITLHVGAGTFQPIKTKNIYEHEMHCEHFYFTAKNLNDIIENQGKIIPVGTTSVRTLESIYWLGVKIINNPGIRSEDLFVGQWEAYTIDSTVPVNKSLNTIQLYMKESNIAILHASTSIIIIPGYKFRLTSALITNFHQPGSTLLLLISAWIGDKWKDIYKYAIDNDFRFLSYGDSSILFRK